MNKLLSLAAFIIAATTATAGLYTGATVGYLIDSEEPIFSARLGFDVAQTDTLLHAVEAEVGITSDEEEGAEGDIVPLFANYRGVLKTSEKLDVYFGAGVGLALVDIDAFGFSDDDQAAALQGFAGVEYKASPTVSLTAGARYIWIDDVTLFGFDADLGDDVALEVGIKIRF